jgi:hypothetical protein
VLNLSDREWIFDTTKDILIYQYDNQKWNQISDKMLNIGTTDLSLGPSGKSPLDKDIVGVLPDVNLKQTTPLRIIIIFHEKDQGQVGQTKGAFVDVVLRP